MSRQSLMKKMGLGGLPADYFANRDASNYRFSIMEHLVKAKPERVPIRIKDKKAFLQNLYRDNDTAALYIHVPWCVEKCTYCFYYGQIAPRHEMVALMNAEMEHARMLIRDIGLDKKKVTSIYFGGGTPSVLPPDLYEEVLSFFSDNFAGPETEFCSEASVSSLNAKKIETLGRYADRVSLGIQTFNDKILKEVARTFDRTKALGVLKELKEKVQHVNIDLIYGLRGQTLEDWMESLEVAVEHEIPALTFYRLEARMGPKLMHEFRSNKSSFPDEVTAREMYHEGKQFLSSCGYTENLAGWFVKPQKVADTVVYRERWEKETPCIAIGSGQNYGHDHFHINESDKKRYIEMVAAGDYPFQFHYELDAFQMFIWYAVTRWKSKIPVNIEETRSRYGSEVADRFVKLCDSYLQWQVMTRSGDDVSLTEGGISIVEWIIADLTTAAFGETSLDDRNIDLIDNGLYEKAMAV